MITVNVSQMLQGSTVHFFYMLTNVYRIGAGSKSYGYFGDSELHPDAGSATPATA